MVSMYVMSRDQWWEFASAGTRTGTLAVVRKDGAAHAAPIWFLLHTDGGGDCVVFNTGRDTIKGRALRRDPRFTLVVDDGVPPFSYVVIHGEAVLSDDAAEKLDWATRISARYMGADAAEAYGRRNAVPEELLVHGRITKVVAHAQIAD